MKKLFTIVMMLFITYSYGQVTLPHLDAMDYTAGQALQTQTNWTVLNTGDDLLISAGNLSYSGLAASTGNKVTFDASGIDAAKLFTQQTTGTVYYSFLLNVTALGTLDAVGGYFTGFTEGTTTTFGPTIWTKLDGTGYDIGLNPRTTPANTVWSSAQTLNNTLFIVVSYEMVGGLANDIVKIWINPTPGASEPVATLTATNTGTDLANVNRILIRQDSPNETPFIEMDELRIGTTWADVTPAASNTPTLTATPTTLTGYTYVIGSGPSTSQSYNLSGTNLTGAPGNIAVTAPADYEVSLDNVTFTASVDVAYATATLSPTPVYVRLISGLAVAAYNLENITNLGGGATSINVTCYGDVTAIPVPTLTATPTTLTGFTYVVGSGPSASQTYNLSGSNLSPATGNITVTGTADYEVSLDNAIFTANVDIAYTTATFTATPVYVRLISGLAIASYNSETIINAGGGATTVDVTCSGNVTAVLALPCLSEDFTNFATGTHALPGTTDLALKLDSLTQVPGWTGVKIFTAGGEIKIGNSTIAGYIITPTIDLSTGDALLSFDIQKYGTDVNKALVYHAPDGFTFTAIDSLVPTSLFTTHTTLITGGTALSKIKIGMSVKRSYLDNISVTCDFITSVFESKENLSVSIYPNPANDQVTVSNIPAGVKEIKIFDITGNMINSIVVNNRNSLNIDMTNLSKGVYFLNMIDVNKTTSVHKIVKL